MYATKKQKCASLLYFFSRIMLSSYAHQGMRKVWILFETNFNIENIMKRYVDSNICMKFSWSTDVSDYVNNLRAWRYTVNYIWNLINSRIKVHNYILVAIYIHVCRLYGYKGKKRKSELIVFCTCQIIWYHSALYPLSAHVIYE